MFDYFEDKLSVTSIAKNLVFLAKMAVIGPGKGKSISFQAAAPEPRRAVLRFFLLSATQNLREL